ncbi:hypothetical protein AAVH_27830 [Aphelenchoides avenae]|nr:hypothetical protein AAVH_27830 [Aphelenchus avenae]
MRLGEPTEYSVEVNLTKGCPNTPIAVNHRPRAALHIGTNAFIEVLRFLSRSELEKMLLVSRRWSDVVKGAEGSLQQRRSFIVVIKFYGESPGMLNVHFRSGKCRILRVLTTRGLSHALSALRSHLRNAFVKRVIPDFLDSVSPPSPPREMRVDIPLSVRIEWLTSLLREMPLNSEIGFWCVGDVFVRFDNLPKLANCALEPHRKLGCVRELELDLLRRDATRAQLTSLLNQPSIRGFSEVTVLTTRETIDTSGLRTILSSWQSRKLTVFVNSGTEPQDVLLTLPGQIIRDFVALRDVNSFVAEFVLLLGEPDSIAFPEMPDVDKATDRRKRFRLRHRGPSRENLSVVTFDHFRRTVLFFNLNVPLAYLKSKFQRRCICL